MVRYALTFAGIGLGSCVLALQGSGATRIAGLWCAVSLGVMAVAYWLNRPDLLGKRGRTFGPIRTLPILPYLVLTQALWHVVRLLSSEPPWHRLTDKVLVGRRLLRSEQPAQLGSVLDLTAELPEPSWGGIPVIHAPILDGGIPQPGVMEHIFAALQELPRPVFIHCAQDHGRTAMIAALILMKDDEIALNEALTMVSSVRPGAVPNSPQLRFLNRQASAQESGQS